MTTQPQATSSQANAGDASRGARLRVSLVQADLRWEDPAENCRLLGEQLDAAGLVMGADGRNAATDLIVLPEMFATGFTMNSREMAQPMESSKSVDWLKAQAITRGCVMTGSIAVLDDGECYNRMLWATPDGEVTHYDKRHLFRMAGEHERYGMGYERVLVELNGFRIQLSVCYDLRFPTWLRQRPVIGGVSAAETAADSAFEYDLLLCVANWPGVRRHPWRTLLQARAIENLAYVVGVNRVGDDANGLHYTGDSMVCDFKGEPILDPAPDQPFIETVTLERGALDEFRTKFPAWMDADHFTLEA
ncbi:nitrilase family protein [Cobetia amphilecti]|nr:nitrilase family protein [Cobetia litoralis]